MIALAAMRAIFFDAVGTLIHPDPPAALAYARIGQRFGSRLGEAQVVQRFAAAFAHEEELDRAGNLRTSAERERRRWRTIVARVLDDVTDAEACFRALYEHFAQPHAWRCDPAAAFLLQKLNDAGYHLGLASNYDERLRSVVAGLASLQRIQHLVISAEVGWRKPAPEFYAALCRAVDLPAATILHLGDDRSNDYDGARAAGLQALLLDPKRRHVDLGDNRIDTLAQLVDRSSV